MKFRLWRWVLFLLVCGHASAAGADEKQNAPAPTVTQVVLLQGVKSSVQLGLQINGQYSYPFTFTDNPKIQNGLELSSMGVISGTPTSNDDQKSTITITDSLGKPIKTYTIVLHFVPSVTVMLDSVAPVPPAPTPNASPGNGNGGAGGVGNGGDSGFTLIADPVYAGGDSITGVLKAGKSAQGGGNPGNGAGAANKAKAAGGAGGAGAGVAAPNGASGGGAGEAAANAQAAGAAAGNGATPSGAGVAAVAGAGGAGADAGGAGAGGAGATAQAGGEVVKISCQAAASTPPDNACEAKDVTTVTDQNEAFAYQFNRPFYEGDTIAVSSSSGQRQNIQVVAPPRVVGEQMRAIVGYQQAGASSSGFSQEWFLDFYISRPLSFYRDNDKAKPPVEHDVDWRWWGNVRVASFPQSGNQTVAEVTANVAAQVGALKLNQLAQGAEFLIGLEYQPWRSISLRGFSENTRQVFKLGLIGGAGATGFFSAPSSNVQVFAVPTAGPQLATFQKAYPGVTTANVGFVPPDSLQFPKQFLGGIRLTTHYISPTGKPLTSPPAMLAITAGENQVITGNHFRGVVGRVEAFYPIPFGNRGQTTAGAFSSIYLFGTAQLRLANSKTLPPLVLAPASGVPASDPSVTLISTPNTRDQYLIGAGVDLVGLFSSLTGGGSKNAAQQAPKPATNPAPAKTDNSTPPPN